MIQITVDMNGTEEKIEEKQRQQNEGNDEYQFEEEYLQEPSFNESFNLLAYLLQQNTIKKCLYIAACTFSLLIAIMLITKVMNANSDSNNERGKHMTSSSHFQRNSLSSLFKTKRKQGSSYSNSQRFERYKLQQVPNVEYQLQRPSNISLNESDYDMTNSINLWNISPSAKQALFMKYKQRPSKRKIHYDSNFIQINYGKDQEFNQFVKHFESNSENIDWNSITLTPADKSQIEREFKSALKARKDRLKDLRNKYVSEYQGRWGSIIEQKRITYNQFLNALQFSFLTGRKYKKDPLLRLIYSKQKKYYSNKYQTSFFRKHLPVCIITPTFNNNINHRYLWNIESILQQDYEEFKHIIIDDASTDGTPEKIAKYLRFKAPRPEQVVLVKNRLKKTAMENIYYAAHKYCNYNQIMLIVDGDDQLIGTQVFKLYNAIYQAKKHYAIYSNHFYYDQDSPNPLRVGLSQDYPETVKRQSSYRKAYHSYSHLRSVLSDLFLLQRSESLKDEKGQFYWTICDNAMYFPALQLSCGRVDYINELTYWYNANTGINDRLTPRVADYEKVRDHIGDVQKHYHCINHIFSNLTQSEQK